MKKLCALILLGGIALPCASRAVDFKQAKFTQIVNNVEVISSDNTRHPAGVNDILKMPDVLHTGPASRAELIASDNTITRVGANTIFSFDPASRTIDLQQGSLLFHSPHGKGGGTIHTGSATASVLGTTVIITTTPNGGFKVLVLEGEAEIRFLNGLRITLTPGQMTFVLPGGGTSPIVVFRLDDETKGSLLVSGFNNPLPSWLKIDTEITRQLLLLLNNKLQDVDLVVGDNATPNAVQVRMDILKVGPHSPFDTDSSIISVDKTANDPLPVNYPPLDPAHVIKNSFTPPNIPSFSEGLMFLGIGSPASGFVGKNIDIDTGTESLTTDYIDLGAFAGNPDFDIMAAGNMRIWQSVTFTGTPTQVSTRADVPDAITLFAGKQMLIAPGSTLEADTKLFGLVADSFGALNINDGSVDIPNTLENDSFYNNIGDVRILSLSDLTIEGMNSYWTVYAGGSVNIQSDGILTLGAITTATRTDSGHDVAIDAGGDVTLSAGLASGKNLNVESAEIYAGDSGSAGQASYSGGSINMNAGGDVFVTDSYLSAYSGEIGYGDVNIFGAGNVDVEGTYIKAGGDVNVEGGNLLTLGNNSPSEVYAGGSIYLTADTGNVYVDYDLYAGGDVDITSGGSVAPAVGNKVVGGNIDVEDSYIYAGDNGTGGQATYSGGSVNINAYNGTVTLNGDDIYAYSGESTTSGNVDVYGSGTVDVENTSIYAGDAVKIQSGGTLNLGPSVAMVRLNVGYNVAIYAGGDVTLSAGLAGSGDMNVEDTAIYAGDNGSGGIATASGGSITLNAAGNVQINNSKFLAYGGAVANGDVSVLAGGDIGIFTSMINAGGNVDIVAGGVLNIGLDPPHDVSITAIGNATLSGGGNVNVFDTFIDAGGDVDISSGGTISISTATTVSGGGNVDLENSEIYAGDNVVSGRPGQTSTTGGAVNIFAAKGNVYLSGDDIYAYGGINTSSGSVNNKAAGNVNVNAGGYVDILNSDVNQDNSVYANAGNYVNLYDVFNNRYDGNSSDTYLTHWKITAGSYVDIGADANVQIYNSSIYADGGNVNINSHGLVAMAGSSTVTGGGDITIRNSYIQAWDSVNVTADNGSVLIYDGSTLYAENGDVNVTATGNLNVSTFPGQNSIVEANGSVYLSADGDININDLTISATAGNKPNGESAGSGDKVSISSGGTVTVRGNYGNDYIGGNYLGYDIGADTTVFIQGSTEVDVYYAVIKTLDGSSSDTVEVDSGGPIYLGSDTIDSYGVKVFGGGDVTLDNTRINAGGDVNITSGGTVSVPGLNVISGGGNVIIRDYSDVNASGSFNVNAGGNIDITYSAVEVGNTAGLTAGGYVNIYDVSNDNFDNNSSDVYMDGWNVSAGSYVDIGADENVKTYNSKIYANDGDVNINAYNGDATLIGDEIYAYAGESTESGNVNIYASRTVDVEGPALISADKNATLIAGRSVKISPGSTIIAKNGDLTINAGNSSVVSSSAGKQMASVGKQSVLAAGYSSSAVVSGNVDIYNSDVYAINGGVDIGGFITLSPIPADLTLSVDHIDLESQTITDPGSIDLIAVNTATVNNSTLTAQGGHVGISGGGAVNISGSAINADAGYADITSSGSTVDIEGSSITASADVKVESSDKLTVGTSSTIGASGAVSLKSDNGDADVHNSYIYSYGANGISIGANGNVNLGGDHIQAYSSGDMNITALGAGSIMEIEGTYIFAGGSVNIESSDTLTVGYTVGNTILANGAVSLKSDNGGVDISNYKIQSYGANGTSISAGGNVILGGDDIEANNSGNVKIAALGASSTVDIEDTYITAGGGVNVESSETLTVGHTKGNTISASGAVSLKSDNGDADVNNYNIYSYGANGTSISAAGNVNLGSDDIEVYNSGDVSISASGNVTMNNSQINAYYGGDINISSVGTVVPAFGGVASGDGNVDLENNGQIHAYDGGVYISAHGNVYSLGNDIEADNGNLEIHSYNGTIHIVDTYLHASDDVLIESSGTLTLGSIGTVTSLNGTGSTIEADGGVTLESVNGDVDVYSYNVYAYGGLLSINAVNGSVDIENSTLGAGSDSNISISGSQGSASQNVFMTAYGGNIEINAGNNLTILNTTFDLGGNISISAASTVTAGNGDVDITTGGMLSISTLGTANVNISGNKILGDNISVSDSIITANNGSVNIVNNGGYSLPDPAGFDHSTAFNVDITGGSTITANSGNVKMFTAGSVDLENSTVSANGSAGTTGNVTVNAGAGITVNKTSINGDSAAGTITLNNTSGQTTIENGASAQAFYLNVNSSDGILIDGTSGGSLKGNTMKLTSGNSAGTDVIAINHEDLSSFKSVNIAAHTLDIEYTTFAANTPVNLGSSSGNLNINNGVHPFDINLIQDNYGLTPITSASQFTPGNSTSAGLHNYAIP